MERRLHVPGIDGFCVDCRQLLPKFRQPVVEVRHAILQFGEAVGGRTSWLCRPPRQSPISWAILFNSRSMSVFSFDLRRRVLLSVLVDLPQDLAQHRRVARRCRGVVPARRSPRPGPRRSASRTGPSPAGGPSRTRSSDRARFFLLDVGVNHADVAGGAPHQSFEQRAVLVADIAAAAPAIPVEGASGPCSRSRRRRCGRVRPRRPGRRTRPCPV